jgi:hypothetical protein
MFEQLNFGGVGEWLKPAVLKTVRPQKGLVGSNPTPSAIQSWHFSLSVSFGQNCRFCGLKGSNAMQISASGVSKPQIVA